MAVKLTGSYIWMDRGGINAGVTVVKGGEEKRRKRNGKANEIRTQ
jgi:hypothetical protein